MSEPATKLTRRRFIARSASLAAGSVVATPLAPLLRVDAAQPAPEFQSGWDACHDRVWLGPEYWANPLQDWQIANGRIECTNAAPDRNVHVLTRQLGERKGDLAMSVRVGRVDGGALAAGKGAAGFRIGVQGPLRDYRNSLIYGRGLDAGISGDGAIFIGDVRSSKPGAVTLATDTAELRLAAVPRGDNYTVTLTVLDASGKELGAVSKADVPASQLVGNLALVCNFGVAAAGGGARGGANIEADAGYNTGLAKFWFSDWKISGSKVETHAGHAFGPILFSQYTLSGGVMKLTAQMPPLGGRDSQTVRLQVRKGSTWSTLSESPIHAEARTATFRVAKWDDQKDVPYRLAYTLMFTNGRSEEHFWTGTVRRDPVDKPVITVGDVTCNIHQAFPNAEYVANMGKLDPDLLAFTGDQFYESSGGYGIIRTPVDKAVIDYLRKWYIHGWTWRELMRDRPSVSLPDDHDVYQGNLWGESGDGRKTTQAAGGYDMAPEWVNVVYRTQTAHHPDPYDPTPGRRGAIQYYGPLTYGRVSFAVLADRQYKSGPEGKVPATGTPRGDHVMDPNFDPKTADVPGLQLLGARQEQFLREWAADWRGADMKAVISQTIFTALPTTHGNERMILRADYDTNAWPQGPRNRAVREMRKAFAFHLAGDQHIPALVQYGVDEHRDGPVAFAGPAVNVGYPRWWEPSKAKWTQPKNDNSLTGDFTDGFGHPLTVLAVKNGAVQPPPGDVRRLMDDKASGLGIVRFDKKNRSITVECWPFLADVTRQGTQMPGWPVTVRVLDNYARKPAAHLPTLKITGVKDPVVQIVDETNDEIVYTLRIAGQNWRPHVFAPGRYTVKVSEPETGRERVLEGIIARVDGVGTLDVRV
jgi:phosphodiesterase/alkaline phosphatase D-like protein